MKKKTLCSLLLTLALLPNLAAQENNYSSSDKELEGHLASLKQEAEAGNMGAAYQLSLRYAARKHKKQAKAWADKHLSMVQEAAQKGDHKAALALGQAYIRGMANLAPDEEQAIKWLSQAAHGGEAPAAYILAELYKKRGAAPLAEKFYKRAFELYSGILAQDPESPTALYWQGRMLLHGTGTEANQALGVRVLEDAVKKKNTLACIELYRSYIKGVGVTADMAKAIHYAKLGAEDLKSAELAYAVAQAYITGQGVAANEAEADKYLAIACEGNMAEALTVKASRLEKAGQHAEAFGYYKRAALMGHPHAITSLGMMMLKGIGTEKDLERGLAYLQNAALSIGDPRATYALAEYYQEKGEHELANSWYVKASDLGVVQAMGKRGLLHLTPNSGLNWDPTATYNWWQAGKKGGDPLSRRYLNIFYFVIIPGVLILGFLGPILLVRYLNKRAERKEKQSA